MACPTSEPSGSKKPCRRKRAAENGKETIAYARLAARIVETRLVAELHPRHITGWWTQSATSSSTATSIDEWNGITTWSPHTPASQQESADNQDAWPGWTNWDDWGDLSTSCSNSPELCTGAYEVNDRITYTDSTTYWNGWEDNVRDGTSSSTSTTTTLPSTSWSDWDELGGCDWPSTTSTTSSSTAPTLPNAGLFPEVREVTGLPDENMLMQLTGAERRRLQEAGVPNNMIQRLENLFEAMDRHQDSDRGPESRWAMSRFAQRVNDGLEALDTVMGIISHRLVPRGYWPVERLPQSESLRWNYSSGRGPQRPFSNRHWSGTCLLRCSRQKPRPLQCTRPQQLRH